MALDHYQQNHGRYTLILLDYALPNMNGLDLAKRIRKINSQVHIIMLSGYNIDDTVLEDEFREAKISEILLKRIHLSDLGACIIRLCT